MQDKYLITLGQLGGFKPSTIERLLKTFKNYKNIWTANDDDLKAINANQILIDKLKTLRQKNNPDLIVDEIEKNKLGVVTFFDNNYPFLLKQIKNPPTILFIRGNDKCLNLQPNISIVGTRKCTAYGQLNLERFLKDWRDIIKITTSGLAYGIDSVVHSNSINNNIKTLAVVASGLDWQSFQPSGQKWLADKIINNDGCLISEFPIRSQIQKYNFPLRNRLIAGISRVTVVIEASNKSGALITAQHALELNREVFALPGDITREQSRGCNQLIADGANPLLSWQDIFNQFNVLPTNHHTPIHTLNENQQKIVDCLLCENNLTIDELIEQTDLNQKQVMSEVSALEINGTVKRDLFGAIQLS